MSTHDSHDENPPRYSWLTHERAPHHGRAISKHQIAAGHRVHVLANDQARNGEQLVTCRRVTRACPSSIAWRCHGSGALMKNRLSACDIVHVH